VGTKICFRVGAPDAKDLMMTYAPEFDSSDLMSLPQWVAATRMADDGLPQRPFSLVVDHTTTYGIPAGAEQAAREIEERSRAELVDPFRLARRVEVRDIADDPPAQEQAPQQRPKSPPPFVEEFLAQRSTGGDGRNEWNPRERGEILLEPVEDRRRRLAGGVPQYLTEWLADCSEAGLSDAYDEDSDQYGWGPRLALVGLDSLTPAARWSLAVACGDHQSEMVGRGIQAAVPREVFEEADALVDAGSPDPIFAVRKHVDVMRIVDQQGKEILDDLVAFRAVILRTLGLPADSSTAGPHALAVRANEIRKRLRRRVGDHTPPDEHWCGLAAELVAVTGEMDPVDGVEVALECLRRAEHARGTERLHEAAWMALEQAPTCEAAAELALILVQGTGATGSSHATRVSSLTAAAHQLTEQDRLSEAARLLGYAAETAAEVDAVGEQRLELLTELADLQQRAQHITGAALTLSEAAELAEKLGRAEDSARYRSRSESCLRLLGHAE
jgi:hypothetical protein